MKMLGCSYTMQESFNRYMVECEYPTYRLIVFAKNRFNRYMVECEFQFR